MTTENEIKPPSPLRTETREYKAGEKIYLSSLIFNKEELTFSFKNPNPYIIEKFLIKIFSIRFERNKPFFQSISKNGKCRYNLQCNI